MFKTGFAAKIGLNGAAGCAMAQASVGCAVMRLGTE